MNDAISAGLANFERIPRWVYPGVLFWLLLPLAYVFKPTGFYEIVPTVGHIAIIGGSEFIIYLIQRHLILDLGLNWIFMCFGVGAAVNFRHTERIRRYLY